MVQSLLIDDLVDGTVARHAAREALDNALTEPLIKMFVPDVPDEDTPAETAAAFYERRDAELRDTWGHDAEIHDILSRQGV